MATLPQKDLTGLRFGRWTVNSYSRVNKKHRHCWNIQCDCGTLKELSGTDLLRGNTSSCGCYRSERLVTHGKSKINDLTYSSWCCMMNRCNNPRAKDYPEYGAVGITVCERWKKFENFLADMGERPSKFYTIDRWPDHTGNYEPGNARWADSKAQARNTKRNLYITIDGVTKCLAEWAEELNINESMVRFRISRNGMDPAEALMLPSGKVVRSNSRLLTIGNRTQNLVEWCREYNTSENLVRGRVRAGWTTEDALTVPKGERKRWP